MPNEKAPEPANQNTTVEGRSEAFRPVSDQREMQSGEKLLVEAYAAVWLIVFGVILLSWFRQNALAKRLARLEEAVSRAEKGKPS